MCFVDVLLAHTHSHSQMTLHSFAFNRTGRLFQTIEFFTFDDLQKNIYKIGTQKHWNKVVDNFLSMMMWKATIETRMYVRHEPAFSLGISSPQPVEWKFVHEFLFEQEKLR